MTYTLTSGRQPRGRWRGFHDRHSRIWSTPVTGTATAVNTQQGIDNDADHVSLIDEVFVSRAVPTGAANDVVQFQVNGTTVDWNFLGDADNFSNGHFHWKPNGTVVIGPSQDFEVFAGTAAATHYTVKHRKMNLLEAAAAGYYPTATLCATNSDVTVAESEQLLVAGQAGKRIRITSIWASGHSYTGADDTATLMFWDGGATSGQNTIMKWHTAASHLRNGVQCIVDQCVIDGPTGEGVYLDATTNLLDFRVTVFYQVLDAADAKTLQPDGSNTAGSGAAEYWWGHQEITGTGNTKFLNEAQYDRDEFVVSLDGGMISVNHNQVDLGLYTIGHGNSGNGTPYAPMVVCDSQSSEQMSKSIAFSNWDLVSSYGVVPFGGSSTSTTNSTQESSFTAWGRILHGSNLFGAGVFGK